MRSNQFNARLVVPQIEVNFFLKKGCVSGLLICMVGGNETPINPVVAGQEPWPSCLEYVEEYD